MMQERQIKAALEKIGREDVADWLDEQERQNKISFSDTLRGTIDKTTASSRKTMFPQTFVIARC